ncbi:MAG: hypothetical protein EPN72_00635 [Nevskiaceae bacterium]|nr:MAG: hypothetical protein EPN63_11385 [Nevskiaceae bacterium]TBR74570.1 MAG: hypothetical protein EPN72_00635 [Nevskiaceae bacterium]
MLERSKLDYFKYCLSPVVLLLSAWGLWVGGNYTWVGLGTLLALLFGDAFLKSDYSVRDQRWPWIYDAVIAVTVILSIVNVVYYAWLVGAGHFATTASAWGAFLSMMFVGFVVAAPPVHELFHREGTFLRTLGRVGSTAVIFDPWREITHVVTHHMHVSTPDDPDYARRGDTVYGHLVRTFPRQIKEAYHLERMMWRKRGRKWWNPHNAWVPRAASMVAFATLLYAVGGGLGMVLALASVLAGPRLLLEVFNYCNHYGLISASPGHFQRQHTWNHLTPFVRILALEITNHYGHHMDGYKPFYALEPDEGGPEQPQFLMAVLLALVPPMWFAVIKPLLKDWDAHYATPQEREIAYAENARAGWHDLNGGLPMPPEKSAHLLPA